MSMTPSWVMLGFVLGALFVVALPPMKKEASVRPALVQRADPITPAKSATPLQLSTIEAVFSDWGDRAVWENGTTEVALFNPEKSDYSEFYEVRKIGDAYYFRTIPRLTRRIINHGKPLPVECPLQFTETEERYRDWLEHGRTERRSETRSEDR